MTRILTIASILVCAIVLSYGLAANDYLPLAAFALLPGVGWVYLHTREMTRFSGLAFALIVLISLISIWVGVSQWLALTGIVFSLLAWDLTMFGQRLGMTDSPADAQRAERAHLNRIFLVLGLGVSGYIAANLFEIDLTFGAAALLALLGIWGVSALVYRLRSSE